MIIAHRGAGYLAPENTLASVNLAWQLGADAVEIDVRLTRDNHIVVIHNATSWHMTHRFRIIRYSTLAQLRKLDFGRRKGEKWAGEPIATLSEILSTVPADKKLFIEIKSSQRILPLIQDTLRSFTFDSEQINFLAFNYFTARETKKLFPDNSVYLVYEIRWRKPKAEYFLKKIVAAGLDGLDISIHPLVDQEFVDQIKSAGKQLIVWTVNDPQEAARLIDMGVDGITTDRPGWLRVQLDK